MTKDDVLRMAREAGLQEYLMRVYRAEEGIHHFAAVVAAAERKRLLDAAECCRMCEQKGVRHEQTKGDETD